MSKSKAVILQWVAVALMAVEVASVQGDSKCSEFKPITATVDKPEEIWMAVMETVPKGHTEKFCLMYDVKLVNSTAVMVYADKDGVKKEFLVTFPDTMTSISSFDLHLDALPDPPPLKKTFHLAHYKQGHYYCYVQCSMNYDIYDDYVTCFTTQRKMSDEDRADVDQFVDALGFQLNDKNATIHIDTSACQ